MQGKSSPEIHSALFVAVIITLSYLSIKMLLSEYMIHIHGPFIWSCIPEGVLHDSIMVTSNYKWSLYSIHHSWRRWPLFDCLNAECFPKQPNGHDVITHQGVQKWFWLISFAAIFFTFRPITNRMLAQNIPFLCYTTLPSSWEFPGGFTEPVLSDVTVPLLNGHLCSCLPNSEAPHPVEHGAACRFCLSTNCR